MYSKYIEMQSFVWFQGFYASHSATAWGQDVHLTNTSPHRSNNSCVTLSALQPELHSAGVNQHSTSTRLNSGALRSVNQQLVTGYWSDLSLSNAVRLLQRVKEYINYAYSKQNYKNDFKIINLVISFCFQKASLIGGIHVHMIALI